MSKATDAGQPADDACLNPGPGDSAHLSAYGSGDDFNPGNVKSISDSPIVSGDTEVGLVHPHKDQPRRRRNDGSFNSPVPSSPQIPPDPPVRECRTPKATATNLPAYQPAQIRRSTRTKKPVERYGY
ncbi:uncharacterized protein LOC144139482 [Haemaphysalis longicornis]